MEAIHTDQPSYTKVSVEDGSTQYPDSSSFASNSGSESDSVSQRDGLSDYSQQIEADSGQDLDVASLNSQKRETKGFRQHRRGKCPSRRSKFDAYPHRTILGRSMTFWQRAWAILLIVGVSLLVAVIYVEIVEQEVCHLLRTIPDVRRVEWCSSDRTCVLDRHQPKSGPKPATTSRVSVGGADGKAPPPGALDEGLHHICPTRVNKILADLEWQGEFMTIRFTANANEFSSTIQDAKKKMLTLQDSLNLFNGYVPRSAAAFEVEIRARSWLSQTGFEPQFDQFFEKSHKLIDELVSNYRIACGSLRLVSVQAKKIQERIQYDSEASDKLTRKRHLQSDHSFDYLTSGDTSFEFEQSRHQHLMSTSQAVNTVMDTFEYCLTHIQYVLPFLGVEMQAMSGGTSEEDILNFLSQRLKPALRAAKICGLQSGVKSAESDEQDGKAA
ncbi:hypothetical protein MMC25_004166 [Agyrium rufum]|nr:hypothetical protein [Agyrium rufum]